MYLYNVLLFAAVISLSIVYTGMVVEDVDDFVPDFFGGRRNDGEDSGMGPPHARPKTRSGPRVHVRTYNFTQRLDHFNSCNKRHWNQRYMVNDAYFQPRPNGFIFIRIGGEAEIFEEDLLDGPLTQLAKEHKALVLSLEHRFYGVSKPTLDIKTNNLRYLSSRQALADLEAFITGIKKQYEMPNPNASVVLYGCSYAGSLAAFHRRLHPNSTAGSIAAFAPIFAVAQFDEYILGYAQAVVDESEECQEEINIAMNQVLCLALNQTNTEEDAGYCDALDAFTSEERIALLHDNVDFCELREYNSTNPYALSSMMYNLQSRIMYMAQYNRKRSDGTSDLGTFCRYMIDTSKGRFAFERYGAWRKDIDGRCVIHNGRSIQTLATIWDSTYAKSGTRQWLYQMCSEFGYFVAGETDVMNIGYFMQTCQRSFNITDLEGNVKRTNELYGGEEGMNSTNVYFLTSLADPWYWANKLEAPRNPTMRVRTMKGISHCHEPCGDCSEEKQLVDAWNDIAKSVSSWIGKPREGPGIFSLCSQ